MDVEVEGEEIRLAGCTFGGNTRVSNHAGPADIGLEKTGVGPPYDTLELAIGADKTMTREGVVYVINLI